MSTQPDVLAIALAGAMNANNTLFNVVIRALHEHGMLDKDKFRKILFGVRRRTENASSEVLSRRSSISTSSRAFGRC